LGRPPSVFAGGARGCNAVATAPWGESGGGRPKRPLSRGTVRKLRPRTTYRSWAARALRASAIDSLWLVTRPLADSARGLAPPATAVSAVGSPTLESWRVAIDEAGEGRLADMRRDVFGVTPDRPLIIFYGGYGDGYLEAVRVFARAITALQQQPATDVTVGFSAHPGNFSSDVEAAIFEAEGSRVQLVVGVASPLLAAMANLTLSQGSTTGVQSLFTSTPSAFVVGPAAPQPSNPFCSLGLIPWARSASGLAAIYEEVQADSFAFNVTRLDQVGVPTHSTQRISGKIVAQLQPPHERDSWE